MKKPPFRFYHLQHTPLPRALGDLANKAVAQDRRILVATPNEAAMQVLDDGLWTFRQDAFLAHGRDGDPQPERTPVWISANPAVWATPLNKADTLILTGGANAAENSHYDLVCDIFDGTDATQLAAARARWSAAREAGHEVSYFQQNETGGWEKKA